jgi:hypothetical protein
LFSGMCLGSPISQGWRTGLSCQWNASASCSCHMGSSTARRRSTCLPAPPTLTSRKPSRPKPSRTASSRSSEELSAALRFEEMQLWHVTATYASRHYIAPNKSYSHGVIPVFCTVMTFLLRCLICEMCPVAPFDL